MLFEVTGMRLCRDEFRQNGSSEDSDFDDDREEILPLDYALMDRIYTEEEEPP